jgi:hypothetical protein
VLQLDTKNVHQPSIKPETNPMPIVDLNSSTPLYMMRHIGEPLPYLILTMFCHRPSSLSSNHRHLHNKLMFIFLRLLMPRQPFSLGPAYSLPSHKMIFILQTAPYQKNFLFPLSILFMTVFGIRYMDM